MKKLATLFLLISLCTLAWAQSPSPFLQGDQVAGLNLRFDHDANNEEFRSRSTQLRLSPCFWYFLTGQIALGGGINFWGYQQKTPMGPLVMESSLNRWELEIHPAIRYYRFCTSRTALYLEGGIRAGFGGESQIRVGSTGTVSFENNTRNIGLEAELGLVHRLTRRTYLELALGGGAFNHRSTSPKGSSVSFGYDNWDLFFLSKSVGLGLMFLLAGDSMDADYLRAPME